MSNSQYENIMERMTRLETTVGNSPEEGMRAELHAVRKEVHDIRKQIYMAIGAGGVVYWLLSHIPLNKVLAWVMTAH